MKNRLYTRIPALILALLLCLGAMPVSATEAEDIPYGETVLKTETDKAVYRLLREAVTDIAENGGSTTVKLDKAVFGDISVALADNADLKTALSNAIFEKINFDMIVYSLRMELPYEMFWTDGIRRYALGYYHGPEGDREVVSAIDFKFFVNEDYAGEDEFTVTTDLAAVKTALENAKAVVAANKDKSDMDKLKAYRDYILGAVSYNDAAAGSADLCGNPWQFVYVFDNDPTTNVVCEGYAKAFKLLCDLSEFKGNVRAYLVDGYEGMVKHMWNIVTTDDGTYLADLTNSEQENVGKDGELFMTATPKAGDENGYSFFLHGTPVVYTYTPESMALYSADIRTLHTTAVTTLKGDVNGDGKVNSLDAAMVLRADAGLITLSGSQPAAADVNGDGKVNSLDAAKILRYDAGLIKEL